MADNATDRPRWTIAPYFIVDDVVASADYYRDKLGFYRPSSLPMLGYRRRDRIRSCPHPDVDRQFILDGQDREEEPVLQLPLFARHGALVEEHAPFVARRRDVRDRMSKSLPSAIMKRSMLTRSRQNRAMVT